MQEKICVKCVVSGKVQGVFYRISTQNTAKELGLTGWVRNLPDGGVEVLACGEKAKIDDLCAWLKQGPPLSKVTNVVREEIPWEEHERFAVK